MTKLTTPEERAMNLHPSISVEVDHVLITYAVQEALKELVEVFENHPASMVRASLEPTNTLRRIVDSILPEDEQFGPTHINGVAVKGKAKWPEVMPEKDRIK